MKDSASSQYGIVQHFQTEPDNFVCYYLFYSYNVTQGKKKGKQPQLLPLVKTTKNTVTSP